MPTVYALLDPRTMAVRYVGITTRTISERIDGHMSGDAGYWTRNVIHASWLRNLRAEGLRPIGIALATGDDLTLYDEQLWICAFSKGGADLTNNMWHRSGRWNRPLPQHHMRLAG